MPLNKTSMLLLGRLGKAHLVRFLKKALVHSVYDMDYWDDMEDHDIAPRKLINLNMDLVLSSFT